MSVYSFSQTQTFIQCPRKYQYKYVDKIQEKEFESSPDLILGQSVHGTLERLYNQINIFKIPNKEEVLATFKVQRDQEMANATKEKPLQLKGEQDIDDYIRRGLHYLSTYYEKYAPFAGVRVVATEASIVFDLNPPSASADTSSFTTKEVNSGVNFRGFIDRLDKEGDYFVINDYKTNKNLPLESKEEYIDQLTLYGLGVSQNYAKYFKKLKARLHYLHFDLTDEREITPERLATVTKKYADIIAKIEEKKFHYNMGDTKIFEPQQNAFCKYCEYYSLCPLRAHLKFDDEVIGGDLGEKTIKGLVDEYISLSMQENQAKHDKELIKGLLIEYLEKHQLLKLFGNTYTLSASSATALRIIDKDSLAGILKNLGILDQALELDRYKLQHLLNNQKLSLDQLGTTVQSTTSWTLRKGKSRS